jgi:hypothetical protein
MSGSYFKKLAEDLLTIEINTIVKSDMSATKLPSSRRQALYEVASDYHARLEEYRVRAPVYWEYAGIRSFGELRDRAKEGVKIYEERAQKASPDDQPSLREKIKMLERIQYQSSQIVGMFKVLEQQAKDKTVSGIPGYGSPPELRKIEELRKLDPKERAPSDSGSRIWNNDIKRSGMNEVPDLALTPDQVILIRKAWEIGTQQIQLQTVIQLDGDVATYISESFLRGINKTLLTIHNDSIATAVGFWQSLVKTFGEIVGRAFHLILGK